MLAERRGRETPNDRKEITKEEIEPTERKEEKGETRGQEETLFVRTLLLKVAPRVKPAAKRRDQSEESRNAKKTAGPRSAKWRRSSERGIT